MTRQKIFSVEGGSVQANDGLYIHRGADEELLELCRAGAFTYVLTPRQMGKSSLMVRTAERLSNEGVTSIVIDLQEIGVELTAEQWYYGLVAKIDEKTSLRTNAKQWWKEHEALGFGQRLTLFLKDVLMAEAGPEERVVIFVDEIDTTLSLKFSDDFFTAVRSIYGSRASEPLLRRLSFVLIGVATPTDLIGDPRRTPFNIGQRVDLTDFTDEEALPLAQGLGRPAGEAREVLGWAMAWTGGHPFLTQQLCAAIASKAQAGWTRADVDAVVAERFLGEDFGKNSNLLFVRDMLTKRAPDRESVLNTYAEVLRGERPVADEGQSVSKAHLKLSGVVRTEDGALRVRNRIYREVFDERWVKKHNPPNWTKRLTRAAAALVAAVLFLMLPVGVFALYQWRQATAALGEAVRQREEAVAARRDAEQQRVIAETRRVEAEVARIAAQGAASLEKQAKDEAEAQRNKALASAAEAERQRRNAEEQRQLAVREKAEADRLRQQAVEQTHAVEQQKKLAEQAQLVTQSLSAQKAGNYQHSVLLAREALRRDRFDAFSLDAYQALSQGLSLLPRPLTKYEGLYTDVALSDDGQYLLSALRGDSTLADESNGVTRARPGTLSVYDALKHETDTQTVAGLSVVAFSPDKKYLVTSDAPLRDSSPAGNRPAGAGTTSATAVWQWSGGSLKKVAGGLALAADAEAVALGPGGHLLAVARRPMTPLARGRGTPLYRPAGLFYAGARTTPTQQQRRLDVAPLIELRKVDDPAARPVTFRVQARYSRVRGLAFSEDGRRLALAQEDGTWVVWEEDGGGAYHYLTSGEQDVAVNAFAISPDGKRLATAGDDYAVRVWQLPARAEDGKQAGFRNSAFAEVLFAGPDADIDESPGLQRPFSVIRGHTSTVNALAFAPDAEHLATASADGTARLWWVTDYAETVEVARMSHGGRVEGVGFGARGTRLVTASADGTARVWEVPGAGGSLGEVVFAGASVVTRSPDGKFALLSDSKEFRVWDVGEGKFVYRVDGRSGLGQFITTALNAPSSKEPTLFLGDDGRHLIAYTADDESTPKSEESSTGWRMRLLDLSEQREVWKREGEVPGFVKTTFGPNGKYVALSPDGGADGTAVVLDLRDGKQVLSLDAQERESFDFECFTSDGEHVVLGRRDEKGSGLAVRVLEVRGGRKVGEWRAGSEPMFRLTSGGGAVKGRDVAAVSGGVLTVWEVFSGRVVARVDLSQSGLYAQVQFSPDGVHFAVIGSRGTSLWKLDGSGARPVATISYNSLSRVDENSRLVYDSTGAFFSISTARETTIWSASTGCEVARVEAGGEAYFNRDGTRVLTVDAERGGAVWRKAGLNDLLAEVCTHVTRDLSLAEWRNEYRLSADAPPLKCENIRQDEKESADLPETGNVCNLPAVR